MTGQDFFVIGGTEHNFHKIRLFMKVNMLAIAVFASVPQLTFANPGKTGLVGNDFARQAYDESLDGGIRGKVTNEKGDAISGATVKLESTDKVVAANDKGELVIEDVKSGNYKLKITAVGYREIIREVRVTNAMTNISVTLTESNAELSEVVVTALGIQRQARTLTYATQKVNGEQLNEVRSANIANSLSGKVAGMVITSSAFGPGSSAKILLRGNRSIAGDNGALIVVDGAIVDNSTGYHQYGYNSNTNSSSDGISGINPDDVESINVLKGSAATALYGTTGANGVVLITDKKGKVR